MIDNEAVAWSNSEAPVTVNVPYAPTASEKQHADRLVVWYVDNQGNVTPVLTAMTAQRVKLCSKLRTLASLQSYMQRQSSAIWVVQRGQPRKSKRWPLRGIVEGTSATTFDPKAAIGRGNS